MNGRANVPKEPVPSGIDYRNSGVRTSKLRTLNFDKAKKKLRQSAEDPETSQSLARGSLRAVWNEFGAEWPKVLAESHASRIS